MSALFLHSYLAFVSCIRRNHENPFGTIDQKAFNFNIQVDTQADPHAASNFFHSGARIRTRYGQGAG